MKATITQFIFQLIIAFQILGVTTLFTIPNVASTGNGKRSQSRIVTGNHDYAYPKRNMGRQIRIPLVAAHGYGKRSGSSTSSLDSETLFRQWLYDTLEDKHKIKPDSRNSARGFKSWGLQNDETSDDSYVHLAPLLGNEERIHTRDQDNFGVPELFNEVENINEEETDNDLEGIDTVPQLDDSHRYSDIASQYRSSSLLNSAQKADQRERLIDILEHKLADAVLDKEGFNME